MNINEKEIIDLYTKGNKSTYEIATYMNTYPNKIRRILMKHEIEMKDRSEAQKNALKMGKSKIPTLGRKRTKEERLKISSGLCKSWENLSEKEYDKRVAGAKKRWSELSDEDKQHMVNAAIKSIQLAGKEGSKLEKFLYREIVSQGYKVEQHKKNLIPNENLEIDMYFPEIKTILEIDGPSHFLPIWGEEKLQKQIKSDSNKTGLILSKGFVIIRVKNIKDSLPLSQQEELKNNILEQLHNIKTKFPPKSKRYIEMDIQ